MSLLLACASELTSMTTDVHSGAPVVQTSSIGSLNEKQEYNADYRVQPVSSYAYNEPHNVYNGAQVERADSQYRAW